jgi:hypothetical protein
MVPRGKMGGVILDYVQRVGGRIFRLATAEVVGGEREQRDDD